jgi:N-acetylglucosamine kinase-like BadF-type ATPase
MDKNRFFIGIDSGGTKSELLIKGTNDNTILKKKFSSVHYSVHGSCKTALHLKNIILDSIKAKKLDIKNCAGICIGLAGARESSDKTKLRKKLSELLKIKNIILESDALIALHGAFKGNDGIILICGTGSILYGVLKGKFIRIGGWGRIIGDHGSGYEIGKMAIKHLTDEYDYNKKFSRLSKAIEKSFSINRKNILKLIYHKNFDVQSVVPLVLELASKKDKDALHIIDKAVEDLLKHLDVFISHSKNNKTNLAFTGSIIESNNILTRRLNDKIKKKYGSNINIVKKIHTPAEGAILLAKNKFQKN